MRKYLFGLAVLGMVGIVSGFPGSVEVVDRIATVDSPADFNVQVQNNFSSQKRFRISSVSSPPPTGSWIGYGNSQTIEPGETANFPITVKPPETAIQQSYRFDINIRDLEGEARKKLSTYFSVRSQNDLKIVSTGLNQNSFEPGEQIESNVTVFNTASSPLNYEIDALAFNESSSKSGATVSGTQRTHSFSFEAPQQVSPGEYDIEMVVLQDGEIGDSVTQTFNISAVGDIEFDSEENDRIFEYSESLYVTNNGNSETSVELNKTLPDYMTPITSFDVSADRIEDLSGSNAYYWRFELEPGETASVDYRTRYWPPMVVLSVLFGGVLLLKRLYTGTNFSKEVRKTENGVKVHIEVENRSNHKVNDLTVTDFVPDVASVKEEFPMAKPVIRKTNNGTRLVWEIDSMEPGEQRVFEYSIKPLVEVEGGITLPEAELEIAEERIGETDEKTVEFRPE